ncbi:MAG: hypothetical protein A2084_03575 [Tenericutes bacterium GWC2_39_45]|nr:MAG: hypothetical protein A2Y43_00930 [Tenericutes bacterium GWA2_38_26]OHE30421.1 MAG: hypothetical protein A2084_03575 [Tenericutes bacterium GWC2_39_45]OHE32712.1 MAG: hypothetical protein A2009_03755 [Tenericutes bacterium GWD2_38_27]HBG32173.1 hypothetical protein [Acholeplasmataceae bacterium]HCB67513.1 hypothetical protein [Acholeplasmataceae bacterium]
MKNNKENKPNEFNPYSIDKLNNIKPGVKIGFLKFWVSGAAFFLTFTAFRIDTLDLLVVLYLLMVLAVEYIINKVIVWMDNDRFPTLSYLPHHVNRKSIKSVFATMGYVLFMILGTYYLIEGIMSLGIPSIGMLMFGFDYVGIDPITFGLFYWVVDWIYLTVKNKVIFKNKNQSKE